MNRSAPGIARSSCTSTPSMSMSHERIERSAIAAGSLDRAAAVRVKGSQRLGHVLAQDVGAVALQVADEREVVWAEAGARPDRAQLAKEEVDLGAEGRVGALDPRRAGGRDERPVDGAVGGGDLLPRGSAAAGGPLERDRRLVDARRQAAAAALEREVRRLALEGEAEDEELDEVGGLELRHAGPAIGLDGDEGVGLEAAQRRAQRVARDVVVLDELALDQPPAGLEVAVEDAGAEEVGELVDRRRAPQRLRRAHAVATAGSTALRAGRARIARPASTSAAPMPAATDGCSPSATTPSAAAVSGSARTRVAVSPLVSPRSPRENRT